MHNSWVHGLKMGFKQKFTWFAKLEGAAHKAVGQFLVVNKWIDAIKGWRVRFVRYIGGLLCLNIKFDYLNLQPHDTLWFSKSALDTGLMLWTTPILIKKRPTFVNISVSRYFRHITNGKSRGKLFTSITITPSLGFTMQHSVSFCRLWPSTAASTTDYAIHDECVYFDQLKRPKYCSMQKGLR